MPDIIEKIDDALELEVTKEKRVLWNKIKIEILYQREEFKNAEAEILRLHEGLLRCKDYTDIDSLNKFIDKLLKIEKAKVF